MVGDHAEPHVGGAVRTVLRAGQSLGGLDDRAQQVRLIHVLHALEQERDALDAHAGVDVLLGQRAEDLEGVLAGALPSLVLHEHEVPDLDVAVLVGLGPAVDAVGGPAVVEDLRARSARAGHAHGPVVVRHTAALDALLGHPDHVPPDAVGLVVVEVHGDPQQRGVDPEPVVVDRRGQQGPRVPDGAFLEVVAEGEVPGHLEEGVVAGGDAHLLDVEGAHTLLDGGRGGVRRGLLAEEVRLEGHHPGVDEQQVGIVQHQRRTGDLGVAGPDEVLEEAAPDLMGLHWGPHWSSTGGLGRGPSLPSRPRGTGNEVGREDLTTTTRWAAA